MGHWQRRHYDAIMRPALKPPCGALCRNAQRWHAGFEKVARDRVRNMPVVGNVP
jgi:hypothetical protein